MAKVESSTAPKTVMLDRILDICEIFKSEKKFKAIKDLLRGRVNVSYSCPFKKGLLTMDVRIKVEDAIPFMKAAEEFLRFFPNSPTRPDSYDMNFMVRTKVRDDFVNCGGITVKNVKASFDSLQKLIHSILARKD